MKTKAARENTNLRRISTLGALLASMVSGFCDEATAQAGSEAAELAKKLSNPVAGLISVPFQNNFEFGGGPNSDGFRYLLNFQPAIPVSLNDDWNLISRTIVPVISQKDMIGTSSQSGLGDILQSAFFLPKEPGPGGWIWGAGPVFLPKVRVARPNGAFASLSPCCSQNSSGR